MATTKKNDTAIMQLKAQVEEKKNKLKSSERFSPITNCSLELDGVRYNLNVLQTPEIVRLLIKLQSYKMAAEALGIAEDTTEFSGYTVDQWLTDLKSKFSYLNRKNEEARLKALETKLHNLLSSDKKVELELEDLAAQI